MSSDDEDQLLLNNNKKTNDDDDNDDESSNGSSSSSSSGGSDSDDDDDKPLVAAAKKPAPKPKPKAKGKKGNKKNVTFGGETDDDAAQEASAENGEGDDGAEDEDQTKAWFEDDNVTLTKKGEKRWSTLRHNGPMFPEEYKPHGISIDYNGTEFKLRPDEEEIATSFAIMRDNHVYYRKPLFQANFFFSLLEKLDANRGRQNHPIRNLSLISFDRIWEWHLEQKKKREARSAAEKKLEKEAMKKATAKYEWCWMDGRKERTANFRVEPPGLFRGRGEHPRQGFMKKRIQPEDITINIGEGEPVPAPPAGHSWKEVVHDQHVTWLATWADTVTGGCKYIMLHHTAAVKGAVDKEKFERARRLKEHIGKIRAFYTNCFTSSSKATQQLGVAMYFIDRLALRVGNEKNADEADTVGCCSLRVEHVFCKPRDPDDVNAPYVLHFDFLGKDSIRYTNDVPVEKEVYYLIEQFRRDSTTKLFPKIDSGDLNEQFKSFMPELTAKVFRTYNASVTLEQELLKNPVKKEDTIDNKMLHFTHANTQVAILCNHQKTVGKGHDQSMANMTQRRQDLELMTRVCEECEEIDDAVEARQHFMREHLKVQDDWFEKYGTDEEKATWVEERKEYEEQIENMTDGSAGSSKKKSSSSRSKSPKKKRASPSKKKASAKRGANVAKRARSSADDDENKSSGDDDDDDDEKESSGDDDDDDDDDNKSDDSDDVPLIQKKTASPPAKKPAAKRKPAAKKKASVAAAAAKEPSSDDDDDNDDKKSDAAESDNSSNDDDVEEEQVAADARGGKKRRVEESKKSSPGAQKKEKQTREEPDDEEASDDDAAEQESGDDDDEDEEEEAEEAATPSAKKKAPAKKAGGKKKSAAAGKKKATPKKKPAAKAKKSPGKKSAGKKSAKK